MDQHTRSPHPHRYAPAFTGAVILLGFGVIALALSQLWMQPVSPLWLVLLALTAVTGLATLRIPGMPISFSISDTFTIIAALVVGPAAGAATAALDGLVLSCLMSTTRRSVVRVLFNMAFPALATWLSAELFFMLAGPEPLGGGPLGALRLLAMLTLFGVVDFGLTTGTVALAIALEGGKKLVDVWREHFVGLWITYFGGIFAAMLMMAIGRVSTLEVLILIAPLPVILYVTFRHAEARAHDQIQHLENMNTVYLQAIEALAQAVDSKDQVTADHVRRVQVNSARLARALGVTDPLVIEAIEAASLLHDVGKIGIPEHILNKPGKLTPSEFEIMKKHAPMGADILKVIGFPYPVVPIVRHHHENWDGTGYPDRLAGEEIPIGARILQVVDCFDALTSDRPYRTRLEHRAALQILIDRKGNMYDPHVVDRFCALHAANTIETPDSSAEAHEPPSAIARVATPEERRGTATLRQFFELGRVVGGVQTHEELGALLWQHLAGEVPAAGFVLFVYDPAADALNAEFSQGVEAIPVGTRVPVGERLSGYVAATGRSVANSDARLDAAPGSAEVTLRSALAVPVSTDRVVAVLSFYAKHADAFTETHQEIAEAAAAACAAHMTRGSVRLTTAA